MHRKLDYAPHVTSGPGENHLTVATYNIHKCVGSDRQFDPRRTARVIREIGADIIALQEVDERFGDRIGLLDLAALKNECELHPVPLRPTRNGQGWHGNLVLVREGAVRAAHQIMLPGVEPRGALVVDLDMARGRLRIVAAHLGLLRRSRALQVETILATIEAEPSIPTLLLGDLNEWRLGARSSLRGLERAFHAPSALVPTFPSSFPVLALDRILGNRRGLVAATAAHETQLSRIASDHLPIKAWIDLDADAEGRRAAA